MVTVRLRYPFSDSSFSLFFVIQLPVCPRPGDLVLWGTDEPPVTVKELLIAPDGVTATLRESLIQSRKPVLEALMSKGWQRTFSTETRYGLR